MARSSILRSLQFRVSILKSPQLPIDVAARSNDYFNINPEEFLKYVILSHTYVQLSAASTLIDARVIPQASQKSFLRLLLQSEFRFLKRIKQHSTDET